MHFESALRVLAKLDNSGGLVQVDWVSPVVSSLLAALSLQKRDEIYRIRFSPECQGYAENIGLLSILDGDSEPISVRGNKCGETYSPLASLAFHSEVERCNSTVNGVFRKALGTTALVKAVCKVVGELHDNVASHAKGKGYSAAQIYRPSSAPDSLEFAIADSGCGFLSNARRTDRSICTDEQAIRWALTKGTTSATPADPFAQRSLEDWDLRADDDAHQGLGLWLLRTLVKRTDGRLWVMSGNAQYLLDRNTDRSGVCARHWPGVVIELEIPVNSKELVSDYDIKDLSLLAEELAI